MIRFLHRSASVVGLCMLALAIGCGSSSKKKVTCDGGPCGDAGKDVSGDVRRDVGGDTVRQLDGVIVDTGVPTDVIPSQHDTGTQILDTGVGGDVPGVYPDSRIDTGTVTPDTRLPDTRLPDGGTVNLDTRPDTTPVQPDTAISDAGIDSPVILDAADDVSPDAADDTAPDAPTADADDDAGADATDADIDA